MPPETFELVQVLLNLAWPAPRSRLFHQVEDELFQGERRLTLIEGGPDSRPMRRQSSEAEYVAVLENPAAAIHRIGVAHEFQQPHQSEKRVAGDPSGTKRTVELKSRPFIEHGLRSRRHAELNVAVRGADPDQRIEERVRAHDIPAWPMFL